MVNLAEINVCPETANTARPVQGIKEFQNELRFLEREMVNWVMVGACCTLSGMYVEEFLICRICYSDEWL